MVNIIHQINHQTKFSAANGITDEADFADYTKFSRKGKSGSQNFSLEKTAVVLPRSKNLAFRVFLILLAFWVNNSAPLLIAEELAPGGFNAVTWQTDFAAAKQKAKEQSKNLLIYFYAEADSPTILSASEERFVKTGNNNSIRQVAYVSPEFQKPLPIAAACRDFEKRSFAETAVIAELDNYVLLKLSIDAKSDSENPEEKGLPFLELPMFQEMKGLPGLAVMDYEHKDAPYYENLVGILPFIRAQIPTPEQVETFLTLPPGTVTQRTLIYAMRIHPEKPLSTMGTFHPFVTELATEHSAYQAKTGVLGHQNFGTRSTRISQELNEASATEIAAQSWSDESLYEAAIGCVRAWRSSSGHWGMARKKHTYYGYDMVQGRNGVWFATGLFAD